MKLAIIIPALNEEEAITAIVERCLAAREAIVEGSVVTEVAITVVSDGSTDRTVERARAFGDAISLIVFERNRGYGAAILEGWRRSDAELLGFIDADGTCDPLFFKDLCVELERDVPADVVLGCRMNRQSRMPPVRRLGNTIFAGLLTVFSGDRIRDSASGMRVLRRSSLARLLPLPTGLHFTPAMSARAILSDGLSIREIDMPYHERTGRSKLSVLGDGLRFLRVIVETAFLFRPARPLGLIALACVMVASLLMIGPVLHYVEHRNVLEVMIYRFVVSHVLGSAAVLFLCAAYLASRVVRLALEEERDRPESLFERAFASRGVWYLALGLGGCGCALIADSLVDRIRTGMTSEHWSRYIVMSFLVSTALNLAVTKLVDLSLGLIRSYKLRQSAWDETGMP